MTLRQFIKGNGITLDYKQRSILGYGVASLFKKKAIPRSYVREHKRYYVIDYPESFLTSKEVVDFIMEFLQKKA